MTQYHRIRCRSPRGDVRLPPEREVTERWLVDAAYFPGGRADRVFAAATEGEVAAVLRAYSPVLPLGAQSSLTGGATPLGGAVLATDRMDALEIDVDGRVARCGAGVALATIQEQAAPHRLFLAPAPTYDGAFVGGSVANNAAGAGTFKFGPMRSAVRQLTVVLAEGSVLDVRRGEVRASDAGTFEIERLDGRVTTVPVPTYRDPEVPKCSAGYHAADGMDLVDLFIGSEGTLGVITSAVLELQERPAASLLCWLPVADEAEGLRLVGALREASRETWRTGDASGLDVPSIEHADRRCLELLVEDGADREHRVPIDPTDALVLIFRVDVPTPLDAEQAVEQLMDDDAPDGPLRRLVALLGDHVERLEVALPGEDSKAARFAALREAVPMAVNHRVRDLRLREPAAQKVGGDFVVPFEQLGASFALYRRLFTERGLDHAIWGHIGDGNVHPNVLPASAADVVSGKEALLAMGEAVVAMGGSPLAEHGVGRHPVKQRLLRTLRGDRGIEEMRVVKRALDPDGRLAPGVLFPWTDEAPEPGA